jgi:WD40 repeat protein
MPWPLSQDYNEAIQCPQLCFRDPELRQGEASCNAIGIPMPRSGNFADVQLTSGKQGVDALAVTPDGRYLAQVGDTSRTVWDLETRAFIRSSQTPGVRSYSPVAQPDSQAFLIGSSQGTVGRSTTSPTTAGSFNFRPSKWVPVLALAISGDGRQCLCGCADGSVFIVDTQASQEIRRWVAHQGEILGVAFSRDGRRAVTAGADKTLRVWDSQTGKAVRVLKGHVGKVNGVALSADGRRVVTGGDDRTVRVWDLKTGKELRRYTGHTDALTSVAISADGRTVISGSADQTVRLWDLTR